MPAPAPVRASAPAGAGAGIKLRLPAILGGVPEGAEADGAKAARPLTKREADELRGELVKSYLLMADSADDLLTHTNRRKTEAQIWSTMDEEDAGILADLAIAHGLRSALAAQAVRGMVRTSNYVRAGVIVGPRIWKSFVFYAQNGGFTIWL